MPTIPILAPGDLPQNPILLPTERWESRCIERTWVVPEDDPRGGQILRAWFTAGGGDVPRAGFAMGHTQVHYPMHAEYDSAVHDCTSQRTGCSVDISEIDPPAGTSIALWYRSSATSAADCLSQPWTLWTSGTVTLNRYAQFRLSIRTVDPLATTQAAGVTFAKTGFSWVTNSQPDWDAGTHYEGLEPSGGPMLARTVAPLGLSKYWANPIISEGGSGWRENGVSIGCVVKDGALYRQWINGLDENLVWRIGYCTSSDGISWTFGNGDAALDLYGDATLDFCADPLATVETDGVHLWCVHGRYAGLDTLIHTRSDDGVTGWDTPTAFYTADSPNTPLAITGVKVGLRYYFRWEEFRNGFWRIIAADTTNKAGPVLPAQTSIAVNPSGVYGDWREAGAATPCFTVIDGRLTGYVKGIPNGTHHNVATSGMTPEPDSAWRPGAKILHLVSVAAPVGVDTSDTYGFLSLPLLIPGRTWIRGLLVEIGAPEVNVTGSASITGAKTVQLAIGTTDNVDGTLSGTEVDVLVANSALVNVAGVHGKLAADYASGFLSGPGSACRYMEKDTMYFLNVIAKAATVSPGGMQDTCEVVVPVRVYAVVDQSAGYR